jgi:hypothetical protein
LTLRRRGLAFPFYFNLLLRFLTIFIKEILKTIYFIYFCAKTLKLRSKEKDLNKGQGTKVIVLDLKTSKFNKYLSIAEAARALNTYPKAI